METNLRGRGRPKGPTKVVYKRRVLPEQVAELDALLARGKVGKAKYEVVRATKPVHPELGIAVIDKVVGREAAKILNPMPPMKQEVRVDMTLIRADRKPLLKSNGKVL